MRVTADMVKNVINAGNGFDTIVAEDERSGNKCGYMAGTPAQLCEYIDYLEANTMMPYKVIISKSASDRRNGKKSTEDRPFVFVLPGRSANFNAAPAGPLHMPQPVNGTVPLELAKEAASNGVRNQFLEDQVRELKAELQRLREEIEEADEELEEAEATLNAAPPPPPLPWWNTEAGGRAIMETLAPIGKAAAAFVAGGFKAPAQPIQAKPEELAPASASITDEDRRILIAVKNYKAQGGTDAATLVDTLLDQFAALPEPIPAHNGNGKQD